MLDDVTEAGESLRDVVERVLQSESFRNAPSSRRLLKYLADHAGEAGGLKEYTIGVDAFGKPEDYDPRADSTVRIQIGRLRKRLFEYYQAEGKNDRTMIVVPKGRLGLVCEPRPAELEPPGENEEGDEPATNWWRAAALLLGVLLLFTGTWAWRASRGPGAGAEWSPELDELWRPFVGSSRPLLISVGNPLFLQFENKILYRDPSQEKWEELSSSANLEAVRKALGNPDSRPAYYYAAIGEVHSALLLGQRLGPRQPAMTLFRNSQLLWQQMAEANVLYLGPPRFFGERLGSLPIRLEIVESPEGFLNPRPRAGEEPLYAYRDSAGYFAEDGEAIVLVTHAAGPSGHSDILTFASNSTFARVGAVEALTTPAFARTLVEKLRGGSGSIPRYFQLLLRVRYKGGVPTGTSYILHRELGPP